MTDPIYHGWVREPNRMRKLFLGLPDELQNEIRSRREHSSYHHAECPCTMDDYFELRYCKCEFDDLLEQLNEHGYTDEELERLFPEGYIY